MPNCPKCEADVSPENKEQHMKMHESKSEPEGGAENKTVTCPTCSAEVPNSKKEAHKKMHANE